MKLLLQRDRRGESVVLGYALLIVLAIGMGAAVYAYLKFYLPKEQPSCPEGVSLAIVNKSCAGGIFSITLQNKGLFSVNGSYIKIGESGRVYKEIVNCPGPEQHAPKCQIYFNTGRPEYFTKPLLPGEIWSASFDYNGTGESEVEVEPLIISNIGARDTNRTRVLCKNAIISTKVTCAE